MSCPILFHGRVHIIQLEEELKEGNIMRILTISKVNTFLVSLMMMAILFPCIR